MHDQLVWYSLSDSTLYIPGLRDSLALEGVYLNIGVAFSVIAIRDANENVVDGPTFPVVGAYVTGTAGMWAATIAYPSAFVKNRRYTAELRAVAGGKTRTWYVEFQVRDDVVRE